MIRARRFVALQQHAAPTTVVPSSSISASAINSRLVRHLHAPSRTTTAGGNGSGSALLVRLPHMSRFHFASSSPRTLTTLVPLSRRRSVLGSGSLPQQMETMQIRWRSAMTADQQDQLSKHMDELAACRDSGNWRAALKLLDSMDKQGFPLDSEMYELTMTACARMGKIEVLPGLLQNMEVDSILPTNRTIDVVMQAYIAAEEWKLIIALAKDTTSKGIALSDAAFEASFESCGMVADANSARQILLNVETHGNGNGHGAQTDTTHYASAIRACGKAGRPDLAASLFAHMEEKRGLVADADTFNQLIRAQIVNGAMPQALQTFSMVNDRATVAMEESIYTATIDALVTRSEFWQASQLFNQMLSHDLSPSVFCYGRMMVAYVRLNKKELANECWQRIVAMDEPSPNLKKYTKMVQQLSTTNDSELVAAVFEYIFPRCEVSYIGDMTFSAAIRAYGRLGRTQTALDLFDVFIDTRQRSGKPLPRSAGIYLAVFNALSRDEARAPKENSRDAKRIWDIMVESVPVVLAPAYASLAGVLASSGDLSTLEELLEHAEQSLNKQDYSTSTRRTGGGSTRNNRHRFPDQYESDGHHVAASDVFNSNEMEEELHDGPSSSWHDELLYNGVISGFSKARSDQSERVMEYLRMMNAKNLQIKDSIIRASTDTFVKHQQWAMVKELMDFIDLEALDNADLCFGDTISKLLDAQAWKPARLWIAHAHRMGMQPPIRGKMEILKTMREVRSNEWQIAYALARETLSFKQMIQENVDSVSDAIEVCLRANRCDLAMKLFERCANHPSVIKRYRDLKIPLRMYKSTLLACMREHSLAPFYNNSDEDAQNNRGRRHPSQRHRGAADAASSSPSTSYSHEQLPPLELAEAICAQMLQMYHGKDALDGEALSLAISIKASMGDDDDVLALFEKMQQHGLEPNSYACNAAIMAYSRAKRVDRVIALCDLLATTEQGQEILREPKVIHSVLFSLAILNDDKQITQYMAATRQAMPHITSDNIQNALLQAGRPDKCVEFFDADVSNDLFRLNLRFLLDHPHQRNQFKNQMKTQKPTTTSAEVSAMNVALSAQLLLKQIAFHGLDKVKPSGVTLRVTKRLVQNGNLREAQAILELFFDPNSERSLSEMSPAFQKEVMEMLLFIHGEEKQFDALFELFDKAKHIAAAPFHVRHYQSAMDYSHVTSAKQANDPVKRTKKQREELASAGALTCLRLFESLRAQFIKPNGPVYLLALQSCHTLGRMDTTGVRVVQDAVEQGFGSLLSTELFRLANTAVQERVVVEESDANGEPKPRRGRGAPPKSERKTYAVNVDELAALALLGHHNGIPISWKLAKKLMELNKALSKNVRNELAHIASVHEEAYAALNAGKAEPKVVSTSPRAFVAAPMRKPPAAKRAAMAKKAAAPGARWGELYLQKMPSDE